MALESLPKISPANFSPDNDLIQVYSKKGDYVGVINPSYIKSSPSGVAGAIQFSDGSAFASDAANLFWDDTNNRLGIGTNAPTGRLQVVTDDATNPQVFSNQTSILAGTASQGALISAFSSTNGAFLNALWPGNAWFKMNYGALQHIFSNAGNVNAVIDSNTTFGAGTSSLGARVGIRGSGSTSATTSLLVQNSAGSNAFQVRDDRVAVFYNYQEFSSSGDLIVPSNNSGALELRPNGSSLRVLLGGATAINLTSAMPNTSAMLDITSTTKGFLPPRMSTAQKNAIATPAAGLVVFDTDLNKLCVRGASAWETITSV